MLAVLCTDVLLPDARMVSQKLPIGLGVSCTISEFSGLITLRQDTNRYLPYPLSIQHNS
jgi:hypothetical protein